MCGLLGQRPILDAERDIANYSNWYKVDGIYFDQMAVKPGEESYYESLTQYAKSLGMGMTIGNPGTSTSLSYVGTVDTLVIYENSSAPRLSYLASWDKTGLGRGNFAFISYGVRDFNQSYERVAAASVGFMFITDSKNYFVLPTYFSRQLSLLQSEQGSPQSIGNAFTPAAVAVLKPGNR
jgi:hypothetical protein